jgi:hypothetical protein
MMHFALTLGGRAAGGLQASASAIERNKRDSHAVGGAAPCLEVAPPAALRPAFKPAPPPSSATNTTVGDFRLY